MPAGVFLHPAFSSYELLDSGQGEKLERFGRWVLRRPDPQALWHRRRPLAEWEGADLRFCRETDRGGRWEAAPGREPPREWRMEISDLPGLPPAHLLVRPTPFKHVGLFPEQAANWVFVAARGRALGAAAAERPCLLNLFGYTGAASVFAALGGWSVTHVDAARSALDWAAANLEANAVPADAVRWILEDASRFAQRERRRGRRYEGILLDPPHYGRGPKGEKWQFEDAIADLLETCRELLAEAPSSFLVLSSYAIGYSPLAFQNMLSELGPGTVEIGELALPESEGKRLLPCGFCGRFQRT